MKKIVEFILTYSHFIGLGGCLILLIGFLLGVMLVAGYFIEGFVGGPDEIEITTSVTESNRRLTDAEKNMHLDLSENDYEVERNLYKRYKTLEDESSTDIIYVFNNKNVINDIVKQIDKQTQHYQNINYESEPVLLYCWKKENDSIYRWRHKNDHFTTEYASLNLNDLKLYYYKSNW